MRIHFRDQLLDLMRADDRIICLTGDLGYGLFDGMKEEMPDRLINPGAAEQLMLGMAVGYAMEGFIPVVYSITPFLLYRPFEFIRNFLNNEGINVKLVGSGRNDDYGVAGSTHYAYEDLIVLKAIPNIRVFYPESPEEIDLYKFLYCPSPCYMNLRR